MQKVRAAIKSLADIPNAVDVEVHPDLVLIKVPALPGGNTYYLRIPREEFEKLVMLTELAWG